MENDGKLFFIKLYRLSVLESVYEFLFCFGKTDDFLKLLFVLQSSNVVEGSCVLVLLSLLVKTIFNVEGF